MTTLTNDQMVKIGGSWDIDIDWSALDSTECENCWDAVKDYLEDIDWGLASWGKIIWKTITHAGDIYSNCQPCVTKLIEKN